MSSHPKIQVGADVFEEASDHGGQVDDVGGLVPLKQGFGLGAAPGMGDFWGFSGVSGANWGFSEEKPNIGRGSVGVWWGQIGGFLRKNPILGWENLGFGEVSRADWGLSEEKPNSGMGNFGAC